MTKNDLEKGQEINNTIHDLQGALAELNDARIFQCNDKSCGSPYRTRIGDTFLSELHIHLKNIGVQKITGKIKDLEKEFKSL